MPIINLPDGNKIEFPNKVTGIEIAEKISKSLAKQALIMSVDGELKDLTYTIEKNSSVKIITHRDRDGLDAMRHDTTHIMAMAVQELFPGTKLAIGPAIKDGFYYDFAREEPFTIKDLEKIEKKMKEIVEKDELTRREVWERKKTNDHDDVSSFTKNILNLFSNNELYKKMIDKGLSRSKLFSINKFHHKLIEIYKDELNRLK